MEENYLQHWGILGMRWGRRRFQNPDGSLTEEGRKRYGIKEERKTLNEVKSASASKPNEKSTKNISEMTDKELKAYTNRLILEKNAYNAQSEWAKSVPKVEPSKTSIQRFSEGFKKFVEGPIGKELIKEGTSYAKKFLDKQLEKDKPENRNEKMKEEADYWNYKKQAAEYKNSYLKAVSGTSDDTDDKIKKAKEDATYWTNKKTALDMQKQYMSIGKEYTKMIIDDAEKSIDKAFKEVYK